MLITQDDLEELIKELGISVTEQTNPVELFDSVKKLIVASINAINQRDIYDSVMGDLRRDMNSYRISRG